ncbi:MAG: MBL fold metallo-hydrolase [Verrucomicrobia bacterium]|nr:MBL fold metallo-hydrolase [Verrucomicrobiota bacterium]
MGTPVITCACAVCQSKDPKNHRLRPSALLKVGGKQILIDAGPDFRTQALRAGIQDLDGVIVTHTHMDHVAGLDDLRVFDFYHKKKLPCLVSESSMKEIRTTFPFFFRPDKMRFEFTTFDGDFGEVSFLDLQWKYGSYIQNGMKVSAFRLGSFAYVLDIKEYTDEIFVFLQGVQTLILSALRERPSPAHLTVEDAIQFAKKVGAAKTYFSHISHDVDHEAVSKKLPRGIELAYDGLEVTFG